MSGERADGVEIRAETTADAGAIREVHASAFGRPMEARLVDALRLGARSYLGLVAADAGWGSVVGHIVFTQAILENDDMGGSGRPPSPPGRALSLGAPRHSRGAPRDREAFTGSVFPLLALGPMAVRADWQRRGVGSALVHAGLRACRQAGHDLVVVLGHPEFYPRFGFVPGRPLGVRCEYPVPDDVFMVAELTPGTRRGRRGLVRYAPEFAAAAP